MYLGALYKYCNNMYVRCSFLGPVLRYGPSSQYLVLTSHLGQPTPSTTNSSCNLPACSLHVNMSFFNLPFRLVLTRTPAVECRYRESFFGSLMATPLSHTYCTRPLPLLWHLRCSVPLLILMNDAFDSVLATCCQLVSAPECKPRPENDCEGLCYEGNEA